MYTMHHGDAVAWANEYQGAPFMALLCDAPYEISFMNSKWDASGVAFDPETWKAFARILHPGAYLFVAAGTLNDDLISVAMRNAGLRKHHKSLLWGYGSGFPKATNLSKAIDKRAGVERQVIGPNPNARPIDGSGGGYSGPTSHDPYITAPATDLARQWAGHRYGQQSLKPAAETILIFQKPYAGQPIDSITATGAGALNIDGARIGTSKRTPGSLSQQNGGALGHLSGLGIKTPNQSGQNGDIGRWPANLLLSHDPRCNGHCVPECPIEQLGQQSGESSSTDRPRNNGDFKSVAKGNEYAHITYGHSDTGTAARYFHQSDWMLERLELQDSLIYSPKAARAEREAGLDPLQTALMRQIYGIEDDFDETTVDDGREKSIDNPYLRGETTRRNTHPTIKPISLSRHLATLLLPPDGYAPRRLLIPFAGVGSEMIGALLAGWDEIDGVELEEQHVKIARARLAYWEQMRHKFDQGQTIKVKTTKDQSDQLLLF